MQTLEKTTGEGMARTGSALPVLSLIIILALVGSWKLGVFNIMFTHHARTAHIAHNSVIDNCFDGDDGPSSIFKMENGRWSQYCDDESGNIYWRIYDCSPSGERVVITQFKQAYRKLSNYISNKGMKYSRIPC